MCVADAPMLVMRPFRRSLIDETSPDFPSRGVGGSGATAAAVDYELVATVSHHGRNAAGEGRPNQGGSEEGL